MKITIGIPDDILEDAVQYSLNNELPIQRYIRAAIRYFSFMRQIEDDKTACGYGDKSRFAQYNRVKSPSECLKETE